MVPTTACMPLSRQNSTLSLTTDGVVKYEHKSKARYKVSVYPSEQGAA